MAYFQMAPILNSPKQEHEFFARQKIIASWGSAENTSSFVTQLT